MDTSSTRRLEQSTNVTWCVNNSNGNQFLCPKTSVCTSDYNFCPYASNTCNSSTPFKCQNGTCVANPALQCCPPVKGVAQVWCPHLNTCINAVNSTTTCCSLNSSTPFYCSATKSCVSQSFQCCSQALLVKCGFEDKCVPANSRAYCFEPFNRSCTGEFSYQCPNDGTCKRSASDCSSPRVCPFGYTTCPDYSCLPGTNQITNCPQLPTCIKNGVTLARCSDGVTCTESFDKCPTQITCPVGQVVCPDNTCAQNQMKCMQPPQPFQPPKVSTCGQNMIRCPDGECQFDCNQRVSSQNCTSFGLIQCPKTFKCAKTYESCPTDTYCPLTNSYTYNQNSLICSDGPNICTWDVLQCKRQSCLNPLFYSNISNTLVMPWPNYNTLDLMSCVDGRCNPKQSDCMTEISCSSTYIKGQSSGPYCHNQTIEADAVAELAFQLQALKCPSNMIRCLSGHCRTSVYDCPQSTSCPSSTPIQCQDGQCVATKQSCQATDKIASQSLRKCLDQKMLLCQSDLKTCVTSSEQCPTMSTCPIGYSKCSENQCVLQNQCPNQTIQCSTSQPIYCRSSGLCVQNITQCLSLTTCPSSSPVKCASDQSCQLMISQCPPFANSLPTVPTTSNNQTSDQTGTNICPLYICQDGSCSSKCAEWLKCPLDTDFQCQNGLCVSNSSQCANSSNGCPFYTPYKCNFTAQCVSNTSQCTSQTQANTTLTSQCVSMFGKSAKSCQSGGCVIGNQTCQNQTESCSSYPNTQNSSQCYVPQCPPTLPIKCENGLCVAQRKFCPIIPFSASQINKCKSLSILTSQNIPVPCGDGSCVARADLCPPLYNCSINSNLSIPNNLTVRCNDGTCKSSLMQCQILNQTCQHRCANGMCVSSASQCLLDNGCPAGTPNRCELNGICMPAGQSCNGTFEINQALSINAPKTSSICYSKKQVTCISDGLQYCAPNKANCINVDTGCNIFTPILCGGKCVQSVLKCTTGLTPTLNNQVCGESAPFRCSHLDIDSCAALPYSSNSSLYQNVCSAKTQSIIGVQPLNKCTSALTPISCGDGSCVSNSGQCRTCNYFCSAMMQCTSSVSECTAYTTGKSTTFKNIDQQCPEGVPYRCIYNGQCVSSITQCQDLQTSLPKTYRSNMIDITCPTNNPFRCINGKCVNSTAYCLSPGVMNTSQMTSPIRWEATQNQFNSLCQVFCADGSCRDRQQNCPIAKACLSPEAPFRCRQGICARDKNACIQLFGPSELETPSNFSAYCQSIYGFNQTRQYFRCEDGTCRPALFNNITNTYTSTCLQYFGCPLTAPYQCSTGQCVQSQSECLTFSHSFCKGKQMCKNLACVDDISQCSVDYSHITLIPFTADINPLQSNEIPFIVWNGQIVATMSIPSNSIQSGNSQSISVAQSSYQRISFQSVIGQREMNSSVLENSVSYVQNLFKVTNQTISLVDSLLTPLFEISLLDTNQSNFAFNATLKASVILPTYFDLASDVCLAKKNQNGTLDCVNRNISRLNTQQIIVSIQSPGIYGLIFSPDISLKGSNPPQPFPTPSDDTNGTDECNWYCQHKKMMMFIYIGIGAFIALCIIIVLLCCCIRKKSQAQQSKSNNYQEILVEKQPKQSQKVVNFVKSNATDTHNTEEQVNQKFTLNDTNSDEEQRKRERINEEKLRQKIEKKLKMQAEEEIQKERQQFNQALEVKEQEIRNLKSALKETESRDKSSSPESRQVYSSAHYKEEMKKREAQMREHFQAEVNRISRELLKQQEEAKNGPPRKFTRLSKDSSIKSFTTGSNYGSVPAQNSAPLLENKNKGVKSDHELNEQWNAMMDEYQSTKGLETQQSEFVVKPRANKDQQRVVGSQRESQFRQNNNQVEIEGYKRRGKTQDQNFKSPSRRLR